MNKFRSLTLLFATLFVVTFTSCDKDDDAGPSNTALLTNKPWIANQLLVDSIDRTNDLQFDIESVKYTFEERGVYLYPVNGDISNGTWEFTDNESKILFDKSTSYETTMDILKLSSTNLTLQSEININGISSIYEFRFLNEQ